MRTSGKTLSIAAVCGTVLAACLMVTRPALASSDMEAVLQDDPRIVYEDDPTRLDRTLKTLSNLGVDTIRVSLFWNLVVPNPKSRHRPHFGPGGPTVSGAYGEWRWQRFDRIVKLAANHGINVMFTLTGPAPRWATHGHARDINNIRPDVRDFRDFATAAGDRYSGHYADPAASPSSSGGSLLPTPATTTAAERPTLPYVDRWTVWNEPNYPGWLLPQWKPRRRGPSRTVSPVLYRGLVDAAWSGLQSTGHSGDIFLIGETAPFGPHHPQRPRFDDLTGPLQFVRELYCLDSRYRPFRGRAARSRGCPAGASGRRRFRSRHPALFRATGWAHHAYTLERSPTYKGRRNDGAPLGALYRLTRTLDRTQHRWGGGGDWPIWITEYGYQTNPPDPYRGLSWKQQAAWMSWGEYLAYLNPRVDSFAQFLLYDDAPRAHKRGRARWATWQSGLLTNDGEIKPSLYEYREPIHVTPARAHRGRSARVFGIYRPGPYDTPIDAKIEFSSSGGPWRTLAKPTVTNPRGYLLERVRPPRSGVIRIVWTDPTSGEDVATRAQYVVRR